MTTTKRKRTGRPPGNRTANLCLTIRPELRAALDAVRPRRAARMRKPVLSLSEFFELLCLADREVSAELSRIERKET